MIINKAIEVLKIEAESILNLSRNIDEQFEQLVQAICNSSGRVIISGIGKSGLIGKKIVATLVSTGTNSIFLHPVEALHGDLGIVNKEDVFIAISNSGETSELNHLLPLIKEIGCTLSGFTGKPVSTMAQLCDLVINTGVEKEACPFNLAPTSSTTAQLAMGDALAVVLISQKKFNKTDFMKSHPGGVLGQRLSCRVGQIMLEISQTPCIKSGSSMKQALKQMDNFSLGAILVVDELNTLKGIITDGDIRHCVTHNQDSVESSSVDSMMSKNPHTLNTQSFLYDALNLMEKHQITVLPIVDEKNKLEGLLHLHDILGKGSFQYNGGSNEKV